MASVNVNLKDNPYRIIVGKKILDQLGGYLKALKLGQDAVIITDPVINKLYSGTVIKSLRKYGFSVKVLIVPPGERTKSAQYAIKLLEEIAKYDVLKKIFIVALGGGVIGDLSGFVASIYKRGKPYVQVPTTFLAQIDSAIGGKTAIDLSVGKNYVGAFYQPKLVFSDIAALRTLDKRQLRNGLAEAVKYGVITDKRLFTYLEKNYGRVLNADTQALEHVVLRCSRIKTRIVLADEKETKGIRTVLNFGHTIGHAIEAAGKFKQYHHGEAIALGMRVAASISHRLGLLGQLDVDRLNCLLSAIGLPNRIKKVSLKDILWIMNYDKKFVSGTNRFVIAVEIGGVKVKENIPFKVIKEAILEYMP